MIDLEGIARHFGGKVSGNSALIPAEGHSAKDRSVQITASPDAPDGCLVHCFGAEDPLIEKDRLRAAGFLPKLGGSRKHESAQEKAEREKIAREYQAAEEARKAKATNEAAKLWDKSGPANPEHPYLKRKGVLAHTLRQTAQGDLLLPIYGEPGVIRSVQTINAQGDKLFFKGAPIGGGSMNIGVNFGAITLCEGYATGCSIWEAFPQQVKVCFSMGNMEAVARALVKQGKSIILAADTGPAAKKMKALAADLDCPVVVPDMRGEEGSDFNDMASAHGTEAVAAAFKRAIEAHSKAREALKAESGPVDLWANQEPPSFPVGIFPKVIEDYAMENAIAMGADAAGFAMSALAACSAAISDEFKLAPRVWDQRWKECARIWVVLIGKPSTKKSPILSRTAGPLKEIDRNLAIQANRALQDWQDGGKEGPQPTSPRLILEDATVEAAQEKFRTSPDGLLVLQDELSGFFGRIEKYGGGSADRAFWLQSYNGGSYSIDRIGRGSILIDNLSATMLGGVQPEALRSIADGADDDGLIQRVIPVMLRRAQKPERRDAGQSATAYEKLIYRLRNLRGGDFWKGQPIVFDDEAQEIAEQFGDDMHDRVAAFEDIHSKLSSHMGKFDGMFSRLCLILHCIEACGDCSGEGEIDGKGVKLPPRITAEIARRARTLIEGFIMQHSLAFYIGLLGMSDGDKIVKDVASAILAHKMEVITGSALIRTVRTFRKANEYQREEVLRTLCALGWLEPLNTANGAKPEHGAKWQVDETVHGKFEAKARDERIRRDEIKAIIKKTVG